jgi:hypothetical protein
MNKKYTEYMNKILNSYAEDDEFYDGELKQTLFNKEFWNDDELKNDDRYGIINDCFTFVMETPNGKESKKSISWKYKIDTIPVSPSDIDDSKFKHQLQTRDTNSVIVSYNVLSNISIYRLKMEKKINDFIHQLSIYLEKCSSSEKKYFYEYFSGFKITSFDNSPSQELLANLEHHNFEKLLKMIENSNNNFRRLLQKKYKENDVSDKDDYFKSVDAVLKTEQVEKSVYDLIKELDEAEDDIIKKTLISQLKTTYNLDEEVISDLLENYKSYNLGLNNYAKYLTSQRMKKIVVKEHLELAHSKIRHLFDDDLELDNNMEIEYVIKKIAKTINYTYKIIGKDNIIDIISGLEPFMIEVLNNNMELFELLLDDIISDDIKIKVNERLVYFEKLLSKKNNKKTNNLN